jgi:hypothetical protein
MLISSLCVELVKKLLAEWMVDIVLIVHHFQKPVV